MPPSKAVPVQPDAVVVSKETTKPACASGACECAGAGAGAGEVGRVGREVTAELGLALPVGLPAVEPLAAPEADGEGVAARFSEAG